MIALKYKNTLQMLLISAICLKQGTMTSEDVSPADQDMCIRLLSRYDPQVLGVFQWEMSQGIERFFLLSYCLACCWPGLGAKTELRTVREWAELEFVFPTDEDRQSAVEKSYYVSGNSIPLDVEVHHRDGPGQSRIFVTIPRFDVGRPITFGTVDNQGKINAYPDYSWHDHQGENCQGLTSVFRVALDECQRLWIMDTGKIGDTQHCPPQLLAFDLQTDKLIYRHIVANTSYTPASLFITPVVDVRPRAPGDCSDTFVYVADVSGFGILVVDISRDKSWRETQRLMFPYPNRGIFNIDNERFELMDGIFGMSLSPYQPDKERFLYFHALASTTENKISTNVLRNASHENNGQLGINDIYVFQGERTSQSAAEAMDRNGIMYFGYMDPPSVLCWNTATEFSPRNIHTLAVDQKTLQFASGVKIVTNAKNEQELWVLTCSFQRLMTGTLSSKELNFRIHAEKVDKLLKNSPCKIGYQKAHGYH